MSKKMLTAAGYGMMASFVVILLCALVVAMLLRLTALSENALGVWPMILSFIALFIGGIFSGAKLKEQGLIIGALTGLLYSLFIFAILFLGYDHSLSLHQLTVGLINIVVTGIGGILGVNLFGRLN
ncbi:TIGR04086 family membrane protein [Pullulanibacillus sp. KACC 23026]|uniref:TIGR04086 family membrane protein n=1 Tax=Pullulanibacillus sp. KACC 23026 TaxID=3028315 RepID=UPI0023AFFDEC|nr:TIGR04086 family membrane protein [Pullulanibacillus sp. KACC 23026]WEG14073.1 TIGR04086 family membrane protein [Pullulanibacillus sp. KACC 23026]